MRIFVINLSRDIDRKVHMEKQLYGFGLKADFVEATDGRNLSEEEIQKIYNKEKSLMYLQEPLRKSEVGCAHSHAKIYKKMIEEHIPYALVLEDDIVLDRRVLQVITSDFITASNAEWLQLNYPDVGLPFLGNWLRAAWTQAKRNVLSLPYSILKFPYIVFLTCIESMRESFSKEPTAARFARPLYLAGAYIVTLQGAKKLLPLCEPILFAADMLPNKARILTHLQMKGITPLLARQQTDRFQSNMI